MRRTKKYVCFQRDCSKTDFLMVVRGWVAARKTCSYCCYKKDVYHGPYERSADWMPFKPPVDIPIQAEWYGFQIPIINNNPIANR